MNTHYRAAKWNFDAISGPSIVNASDYQPYLHHVQATEPLLWVYNSATWELLDATPASRKIFDTMFSMSDELRTLSRELHINTALEVVATGESKILVEWLKLGAEWQKYTSTKCHIGGGLVFEVGQNITHLDQRAPWIRRISLVNHRLELDDGESISFAEFSVLHMLVKGMSHTHIAEALSVSPKTVDYRIARIKNALRAESTEAMMLAVYRSGLIHLAVLPLDVNKPARTELELYSWLSN